jgi:1,4-dihydroxy-2-naphthoate octaprenyltransferase
MKTIGLLIRLARPHFLLGGILLFALGAGIGKYLGYPIDWGIYLIGQAWGTLIQLSTHFLNEYFDAEADHENQNRTFFSGGSGAIGPGKLPRSTALYAAIGLLAIVASLTVLIISVDRPSLQTIVFMGLIFFGAFFYAVPPIQLEGTGYGELTTSILVANLVPAFAFSLQTHELHRLVAMATFPLTFLHLSMLLAFEVPDYATDSRFGKRTLLVRLGWQAGMRLHNLLIIAAYIVLALAVLLKMPPLIALPAFLTLPIGLLEIWYMNRIAAGARPNWTALTLTAIVLFAATAYLLTFAFWTR